MSRELRLSGIHRTRVMPGAVPSPRIRVHIPAPLPISAGESVSLLEARGVLYGALLGGGLWALIGLVVWFIVH